MKKFNLIAIVFTIIITNLTIYCETGWTNVGKIKTISLDGRNPSSGCVEVITVSNGDYRFYSSNMSQVNSIYASLLHIADNNKDLRIYICIDNTTGWDQFDQTEENY